MTNNKQQTAVEWLVEQLRNNENIRWRGTPFFELSEQAKKMEKEIIENAWISSLDFGIEKMKGLNTLESKDAFEKFYKTTYGGNK